MFSDAALPQDVSGVQPVSTSRFTEKLLLSAWQCPCTARSDAQGDRFVRAGHLSGKRGSGLPRSPAEYAEHVPFITATSVVPDACQGTGTRLNVMINNEDGQARGQSTGTEG